MNRKSIAIVVLILTSVVISGCVALDTPSSPTPYPPPLLAMAPGEEGGLQFKLRSTDFGLGAFPALKVGDKIVIDEQSWKAGNAGWAAQLSAEVVGRSVEISSTQKFELVVSDVVGWCADQSGQVFVHKPCEVETPTPMPTSVTKPDLKDNQAVYLPVIRR